MLDNVGKRVEKPQAEVGTNGKRNSGGETPLLRRSSGAIFQLRFRFHDGNNAQDPKTGRHPTY